MKKFLVVLALVLAVAGVAVAANYRALTATGAPDAVVMQRGQTGQNNILIGYSATGDVAGSVLSVYVGGLVSNVAGANASGQKVLKVASTTGFTAGDKVMVQLGTANQWATIDTVQAGVSITLLTNLSAATASGDRVYRMDKVAALPIGAATTAAYANALGFVGSDKQMPMAAHLNGSVATSINMFSIVQQ